MSNHIETVLAAERGLIDENYKCEMAEFSTAVFGLMRGRSLDQVVALGVGSVLGPASHHSLRQASVLLNFEEKMKNAHAKFWHEPLASDQELAYLRSMDWEVKLANDLQTDRFEDAGIIGDNTSIFFMPRADYPLLNDLIMKLQKADALQNSFFVTNNFFIRNEDSESDNEDPEKSVVLEKNKTLCGQPYLITFLSECKFVPISGFGGALANHAILYTDKKVYFPIPTKIDTIMNELAAHKTLIDDLRADLNSRGEPQRKKPGNS